MLDRNAMLSASRRLHPQDESGRQYRVTRLIKSGKLEGLGGFLRIETRKGRLKAFP
jgi:hypothetical protein